MIKSKVVLIIIAIMLMSSCTTRLPATLDDTTTFTPPSTITRTPIIKPSITSTPTYTPTNTPTPIPTITWTPLPTLSAYERDAKIKELLETNGGCELPCWWGITPYEITWPETLHFLSPLITSIGQGGSHTFDEGGIKHFTTTYSVDYEIAGESEPGRIDFSIQDDVVIGMSVFPPGTQSKYKLYQVLSLLGMPKQIFLGARSASSSINPMRTQAALLLDYSDVGVWVTYEYKHSKVGENLLICPQPVGGKLVLFDPAKDYSQGLSIEEYADGVVPGTAKKLEDVTNMTVEVFYNTFINPYYSICLETPDDIWP